MSAGPASLVTRPRFFTNVLWNWFGISITLFSALILSPFIIRRLGDENYGLWSLTVSLVEYYWLLDFGMRSATIRYSAHYMSTGEHDKVNEVVNTNLAYALSLAPVFVLVAWFAGPLLAHTLHVANPLFARLVLIVVTSWAITSVLSVFTASLEGFQRFDITNQASFIGIGVRSLGTAALLLMGHGVVALAFMTMIGQVLLHFVSFVRYCAVFPQRRFAPRYFTVEMLRQMLSYGVHTVVASLGQRTLSQSPPLLIGYFLPTRFVGYFTAPQRLLDYVVEGVARIGNVSNSKSAELAALDRKGEVLALAEVTNRYSLALFLPLSIFLAVYGRALLSVWIKPEFAAQSAGVLTALLAGITLGNAAEFNTASILFGIGRQQAFSKCVALEAALAVAGLCYTLPRYGVTGGAWVVSMLMVANRAIVAPYWLTRELKASYWRFVASVNRPLIAVIPVGAVLFALRTVMPGRNWAQLILAGVITMAAYLPFMFLVVRRQDRALAVDKLRSYAARMKSASLTADVQP